MTKLIQHVSAKRWFSKLYGNTYFTATLHFNDGTEWVLPYQYGGGEYYRQFASEYALNHELAFATVCTYSVADVGRKSDL